ncbi:MAG: hypothetical protein HGA37_16970 [Lentimicrobium sp.]|nr:hypothetical protein [Lentimicrobium sp.]
MSKKDKAIAPDRASELKNNTFRAPSGPTRKGNYSGIGYGLLESRLTQAERWNMPFMDPEFEYEQKSD